VRRRAVFAVAAVTVWALGSALGSIATTTTAHANPFLEVGLAHANYIPRLDGSKPIFILVLGSDARPGTPVDRGLSDSIHIVAINLAKNKVSILGFPRDSWVPIPGHGTNKINAAMAYGGPQLTIQTVEALTGIKLDYYVLTGFVGVETAIDAIGGLTIDVPFAMHDPYSKADFNPGVQTLNGHDTLAFARDRHSLLSGDFGRSEDQGRVALAALTQLRKQFAKDPSRLLVYVGAAMRNVQTDMTLDQVMQFAYTALSVDPKHIENMVVPGSSQMAGAVSIVQLSSSAHALYADLKNDAIVSKKNIPPSPTAGQH
jgi:LCP family protein required for cell wall assembly